MSNASVISKLWRFITGSMYEEGTLGNAIFTALSNNELDVTKLRQWKQGAISTPDIVWMYGGKRWTGFSGTLGAAPSFNNGYLYRLPSLGFTPEQFGAVGNGTANDGPAWLRLAAVVNLPDTQCRVVHGRHGATYYNAFIGGRLATPTFTQPGTQVYLYGCIMTARPTVAASSGTDDEQRALLKFTAPNCVVHGYILDGGEPQADVIDRFGNVVRTQRVTRCNAICYGIDANEADDIDIKFHQIKNTMFNIRAVGIERIKVDARLDWSSQLVPVTGDDLNLGAGIKLSSCSDIDVRVMGTNNANALVEVEPDVVGGSVWARSKLCANAGLTTLKSSGIDFNVICEDGYVGARFCQGAFDCTGVIIARRNEIWGVEIATFETFNQPMHDLNLKIIAHDNGAEGLRMSGLPGQNGGITDCNIHLTARRNNVNVNGTNVLLSGVQEVTLSGSSKDGNRGVDLSNCNGVVLDGMDLRGNAAAPWLTVATSIFSLVNCQTSEYGLTTALGIDARVLTSGLLPNPGGFQISPLSMNYQYSLLDYNPAQRSTPAAGAKHYDAGDGNRMKYTPL